MAVLNQAGQKLVLPPVMEAALKSFFWHWFETHKEDHVFTHKVLIFSFNVRVKDLKPVFELLFGGEPLL